MAADPEWEWEMIDEGEVEKLEWEVREMAKKISEYRKTLPDHLRNTLDSALSSFFSSSPLPSSSSQRLTIAAAGTEEQECEAKMIRLKEIVSRNAQTIPRAVKRVRDCIHKLDSFHGGGTTTIHPAFTTRTLN